MPGPASLETEKQEVMSINGSGSQRHSGECAAAAAAAVCCCAVKAAATAAMKSSSLALETLISAY